MKVRSRVGSCDAAHSILVLSPTLTSALDGARVIFVASEERDTCYPLNAGERLSLLLRTISHMLVAAEGSSEMLIHHITRNQQTQSQLDSKLNQQTQTQLDSKLSRSCEKSPARKSEVGFKD